MKEACQSIPSLFLHGVLAGLNESLDAPQISTLYRCCICAAASSSDSLPLKSGQMTAVRSGADPRIVGAPWGRTPHRDDIGKESRRQHASSAWSCIYIYNIQIQTHTSACTDNSPSFHVVSSKLDPCVKCPSSHLSLMS